VAVAQLQIVALKLLIFESSPYIFHKFSHGDELLLLLKQSLSLQFAVELADAGFLSSSFHLFSAAHFFSSQFLQS
jgi:hypothetical protein